MKDIRNFAYCLAFSVLLANTSPAGEEAPEPEPEIPAIAEITNLDDYLALRPEMTPDEFAKILERAEKNDPAAMDIVMLCYEHAFGTEQNFCKSEAWQKRAFASGAPIAMLYEARRLRDTWGQVERIDIERSDRLVARAEEWLKPRSERGNPAMQTYMALCLGAKDPYSPEITKALEAPARGNFSIAAAYLGHYLISGSKTLRDKPRAVRILKIESERGNIAAMEAYSFIYHRGFGAEKDESKAQAWVNKAAEKGSARARAINAMTALNGADREQALKQLENVLQRGFSIAGLLLYDVLYEEDKPLEEKKKAVEFLRIAAEGGNAKAAFRLSSFYNKGVVLEKSEEQYQRWLAVAAKEGWPLALLLVDSDPYMAKYRRFKPFSLASDSQALKSDSVRDEVAKLINQAGDDEYEKRKAARESLFKVGMAAQPQLRVASEKSEDAEIREAAAQALKALGDYEWAGVRYANPAKFQEPLGLALRDKDTTVTRMRFNFSKSLENPRYLTGTALMAAQDRKDSLAKLGPDDCSLYLKVEVAGANKETEKQWTLVGKWVPHRKRFEGTTADFKSGFVIYPHPLSEEKWADLEP
ncbi:MAG: sel1 repeat family protein [Planctomycetes bacterium]|nr:sel1 repeat family protein [Planctomycetota bacterium]